MPSFFILLRSVLGWRLRIFAAPLGPSMTHADFSRTERMWWRSTSSRVPEPGALEAWSACTATSWATAWVPGGSADMADGERDGEAAGGGQSMRARARKG